MFFLLFTFLYHFKFINLKQNTSMQSKEQIFKLLNLHFAMIPGVHILSLHTPLHRTHSSSTRCAPTHVTVPPERVSHVVYNPIMPTNRHIIVPTAHLLRARNHPIFRAPTLVAVHSEFVSSVVNNFIVSADRYAVSPPPQALSVHITSPFLVHLHLLHSSLNMSPARYVSPLCSHVFFLFLADTTDIKTNTSMRSIAVFIFITSLL